MLSTLKYAEMMSNFQSLTAKLRTHLLIVSFFYILCSKAEHLDLSGKWRLQNHDGSMVVKEASVPGYVHTTLLEAKVIDDPYSRNNDELYRWIDYDNWTYSTTFDGA